MAEVILVAETRTSTGSAESRRLRALGKVPAVLYGHGVTPLALTVDRRELRGALERAGLNALLALEVSDTRHLAMARQLQRHPVRGNVQHVDFVIVRRDEVVSADVPVRLVGEALEVTRADGVVEQQLFNLSINATPGNIPPHLDVDISGLTVGDTVRVADLQLPAGVTTDLDPEEPVLLAKASGIAAEVEAEEAEAAAEAAEAAEGAEAPGGAGGDQAASSES